MAAWRLKSRLGVAKSAPAGRLIVGHSWLRRSDIALRWRNIAMRWRNIAMRWRNIAFRWHNIALRWRNIALRWHNIALLRACAACLQHGQRTFGLVGLDILEGRTFVRLLTVRRF